MPIFELDDNGRTFEVEAPDMDSAISGLRSFSSQQGTEEEQTEDGRRTYAWSEVPGEALRNLPSSTGELIKGTAQAIVNPIETIRNLYNAGFTGIVDFYLDRYGSAEGFKRALAEDPAGVATDWAGVGTGGGTLLARAPGVAGKIGRAAAKAGRATDPIALTGGLVSRVYDKAVKPTIQTIGGGMSSTYSGPKIAAGAGYEGAYAGVKALANRRLGTNFDTSGGKAAKAFTEHAFGKASAAELDIGQAAGKAKLREKAQADLDADLAPIFANRSLLTFAPIRTALEKVKSLAFDNVGRVHNEAAAKVWNKVGNVLDEWGAPISDPLKVPLLTFMARINDPTVIATKFPELIPAIRSMGGDTTKMTAKEYVTKWADNSRTAEGFDKLKRRLQNIHQGFKQGPDQDRASAAIAAQVVKEVRDAIIDKIPEYKTAMSKYGDKMRVIQEIEDALGTSSRDSTIRRMTAAIRDTVFSNFSSRLELIRKTLKESGAPEAEHLLEKAAGQQMRGKYPRGLMGMASAAGLGYLLNFTSPLGIAVMAAHSPRLMGRAAYTAGKIEGLIAKPLLAAERALTKYTGVTRRGLGLTAAEIGQVSQQMETFKADVQKQAAALGYTLHPKALDGVVAKLTSEDPEVYIAGLKTLGKNKRLMEIITKMGEGTNGEQ